MTRSSSAPDTTDSPPPRFCSAPACTTLCLEANTYAGGMAATVELIDGFRYEIAGSVQFPTASEITKDLGLDTLPTVDADVMSVNIGEAGEEAMIFYRDPMELMTHLADKHGTDAVTGMAELIAWSQGPARALGRFDVRTPPKTIDEMYACATNEAERRAIHETLFGSAMDVIDRYLPDKAEARRHARHARVPGPESRSSLDTRPGIRCSTTSAELVSQPIVGRSGKLSL